MDNFGNIVQNSYNFGQDGDDKGFCQCIIAYKAHLSIRKKWVIDNTIPAIPPAKTGMRLDVTYTGNADKRSKCTIYHWTDDIEMEFQEYKGEGPGAGRLNVSLFRYVRCDGCKETKDEKGKPNCKGGGHICNDWLGGKGHVVPGEPPTPPGTPWTPKMKELLEDMWDNKKKPRKVKKIMKNFVFLHKMFKKCGPHTNCKDSECPKP
jgi:hypothetical protein